MDLLVFSVHAKNASCINHLPLLSYHIFDYVVHSLSRSLDTIQGVPPTCLDNSLRSSLLLFFVLALALVLQSPFGASNTIP